MKKGLLQRLKAEGSHSPADVILTVDIGHLELLSEFKLLKKIKSKIVEANIPVSFRYTPKCGLINMVVSRSDTRDTVARSRGGGGPARLGRVYSG